MGLLQVHGGRGHEASVKGAGGPRWGGRNQNGTQLNRRKRQKQMGGGGGMPLVVQLLRLCSSNAGAQAQSLVRELDLICCN